MRPETAIKNYEFNKIKIEIITAYLYTCELNAQLLFLISSHPKITERPAMYV